MNLLKIRMLDGRGFSHHVLIAVLVISGIAGFGGWRIYSSSAAVTAASVCGTGYVAAKTPQTVVRDPYGDFTQGPAKVHLLINRNLKKLCAVTMSTGSAYGVSKPMAVRVRILTNGSGPHQEIVRAGDSGTFKYYAGPAYLSYAKYASNAYYYDIRGDLTYGGKTYWASGGGGVGSLVN